MDIQKVKTTLQRHQLFKNLDDKQLDALIELGREKLLTPGANVYTRGEASDNTFCLIVSGKVSVVAKDGSNVKFLGAGEVIGEIALFAPQRKRTVTIEILEPTEMFAWNVEEVTTRLPDIRQKLFKLVWRDMSDYYEE